MHKGVAIEKALPEPGCQSKFDEGNWPALLSFAKCSGLSVVVTQLKNFFSSVLRFQEMDDSGNNSLKEEFKILPVGAPRVNTPEEETITSSGRRVRKTLSSLKHVFFEDECIEEASLRREEDKQEAEQSFWAAKKFVCDNMIWENLHFQIFPNAEYENDMDVLVVSSTRVRDSKMVTTVQFCDNDTGEILKEFSLEEEWKEVRK